MSPHRDGTEPDPMLGAALRDTLRDQSETITAPPSLFAATQRRARQIRQRRIGGAAAASVVVVALGVGLPLGLTSGDHRDSLTPIAPTVSSTPTPTPSTTEGTPAPSGSASNAPLSPTTTPSDLPLSADASSWAFRGDAGVANALKPAAASAVKNRYPDPHTSIQGIWAGTTPSGGWRAYIFRISVGGQSTAHLGVWMARNDGTDKGSLVRDDILETGTIEIDQQIPGDPSDFVVVLGPPTANGLVYRDPATTGHSIPITNGIGLFSRSAQGNGTEAEGVELSAGQLIYSAPLSAGGFVTANGAPMATREFVVNGLFQAWLRGDRTAAAHYATAAAVEQMFAFDPASAHYVGGACTSGPAPARCNLAGRNMTTQPALLLTVDGGVSAGYKVTAVKLGSE